MFPAKMEEYHCQAERECEEKVTAFCRSAIEGKLSTMSSLLVEGHIAVCPKCREYFVVLRSAHADSCLPPHEILEHVIRLLKSLPPGEEFFLD